MLRIHFTPDDLARTCVAADADPMWEGALSFHWLHDRRNPLVFRHWRQQVRKRVPEPARRMLLAVNPPRGNFPDFLTPAAGVLGLRAGLEQLRSTQTAQLRSDVEGLARERRLPGWANKLAAGDRDVVQVLTQAVSNWYDVAVGPHWAQISGRLEADRAVRSRALQAGGIDSVLAGLPAPLRWQPPVLESPYPMDRDLHLNGRGLMLVPVFFCLWHPVTLINPNLPPVLAYPVESELDWLRPGGEAARPTRRLADLIGSTRAATLTRLGETPLTTGELARTLHVAPSSASEHITVLRGAGLLATHRDGGMVIHRITALGIQLLDASV